MQLWVNFLSNSYTRLNWVNFLRIYSPKISLALATVQYQTTLLLRRVGLNLNFEFESAHVLLMNLNLNSTFAKSMNLNLNLVFSKSMHLNLKIKNKLNGSNQCRR